MVPDAHAVAIAPHAVSMWAALLFLRWALETADILPALGLVVVAIGMTQATARSIGHAVLIIAPIQQGFGIEMFVAPMVGKERDATVVMHPVVVVNLIIGRVAELNLPRQPRHSQGAAVANELAALICASRISGMTQRQF